MTLDEKRKRLMARKAALGTPKFLRDTELVERMEAMDPDSMAAADISSAAMRAGDMVRKYRRALHMTQVQLSERTGIDQGVISSIESGKGKDGPTFATMEKLAKALGMEFGFFASPLLETQIGVFTEGVGEGLQQAASLQLGSTIVSTDPLEEAEEELVDPAGLREAEN